MGRIWRCGYSRGASTRGAVAGPWCAAIGSLMVFPSVGLAADLDPIQPLPPAIYDWTGLYAGLQAGYATGRSEITAFDPEDAESASLDFTVDGFVGGGHVGYLTQFGRFVVGAEGDIEYTGLEGDFTDTADDGGGSVSVDVDVQGSLRARLGYAFDRILPYATGGLAIARMEVAFEDFEAGQVFGYDSTRVGWTVGAGVVAAVTERISAGVEYRYTDYGSAEGTIFIPDEDLRIETEADLRTHAVRGRVSLHFGNVRR